MALKDMKKVVIMSDLHNEPGVRKGIDESVTPKWVNSILDLQNADMLVVPGDWGRGWTQEQLSALLRKKMTIGIYGNHDKIELLAVQKNADGSKVLQNDGEIRNIGGLRFGFINGIVDENPNPKRRWEKSREEFLHVGSLLAGKIDVLCTHESIPQEELGLRRPSIGAETMREVVGKVKPAIIFSGHITPRVLDGTFHDGVLNVILESNQHLRHYAVLDLPKKSLSFWLHKKRVGEIRDIGALVDERRKVRELSSLLRSTSGERIRAPV